MKTKTTVLSAALLTLLVGHLAHAELAAPAWDCELQTTKLKGFSLAIGKAISVAHGKGNVHCVAINGPEETDTAVNVHMIGVGVGLGFTYMKELDVKVMAAGLSTPNDLFGTLKLEKNISITALDRGFEAGAYVAANRLGASVGVEFDQFKGIGAEVSAELQAILITKDNTPDQEENESENSRGQNID